MENKNYKQISVKNIKDNMIIANDIFDSEGNRLLAKGFKITSGLRVRRLLNQHNIWFVKVLKEDEDILSPVDNITANENTEILKMRRGAFQVNRNKVVLKQSLNKFIMGEKVKREEIEDLIQNTIELFKNDINIFQIMQNVKNADDITYAHCQNVSLISYSLGEWMELNEEDLKELALAGMLIDIGKTKVDEKVLNKEGKLVYDEFVELKKHSIFSYEIIKDYAFISDRVKKAVLHHHERIDGSGYPMGLKRKKYSLTGKDSCYSRCI